MKDYTEDGVSGCCINPTSIDEMVNAIKKMKENESFRKQCGHNNFLAAKYYDGKNTDEIMKKVYGDIVTY